jgi:zinc finger protein BrlA
MLTRVSTDPTRSYSIYRIVMDMFVDRKPSNNTSSHSNGVSPSGYNSVNSSFGSSAESSTSWEIGIGTPGSTSQPSSGSVKSEDACLSTSLYSSDVYGTLPGYCPMSALTQDMMNDFQNTPIGIDYSGNGKSLQHQSMMGYDNFATYTGPLADTLVSYNGLPSQMSLLDHDLSSPTSGDGSSPVSSNFIVPSQTFINGFELQSPMRPAALHFDLHYDSPESDYAMEVSLESSPPGSMAYLMPPGHGLKSSSATPTRPQTSRQPKPEPLESPAALHRTKSREEEEKHKKCHIARLEKRRLKKELRDGNMPGSWHMERMPKKTCKFEGCNGRFQRQEHLKRHEKTHTNAEVYPCKFCEHIFNRTDNLKQHVGLHTVQGKKSSRTKYHPDALAWWQELDKGRGKPRRPKVECGVKIERGSALPRALPLRTTGTARRRPSSSDIMIVHLSGSVSGSSTRVKRQG